MRVSYCYGVIIGLSLVASSSLAQEPAGESPTLAPIPEGLDMECLLEPYMTVKIGTPVPGALAEVVADRGDVVRKGALVARLDSRAQVASVSLSKARAEYAKRRMERNEELAQKELLSSQEQDEMQTDRQLAELELLERETQVAIREIRSPVNGVVVERFKGPGEYVQEEPILELAQIDPLRIEVVVPVSLYGKVIVGMVGMLADLIVAQKRMG